LAGELTILADVGIVVRDETSLALDADPARVIEVGVCANRGDVFGWRKSGLKMANISLRTE
jgi:hypothetical protein